jgi:hypothetical protein
MGPKCSCLFEKKSEFFNFKKEEDPNAELNYIIQNLTKGDKVSKTTTSTTASLEDRIKIFDDPKKIRTLIKLQTALRRCLAFKRFKRTKKYLVDHRNKQIASFQKSFISPNRAELYYQSKYDPNGWKKYYSEKTDKFNVHYGLIVKTEILVGKDEYYTGYVNIHNKKHGYGILYKKDGSKYEGFWQDDEFTGWGRHIDPEGTLYEGM